MFIACLASSVSTDHGVGEHAALRLLRDALVEAYREDLFVLDFQRDCRIADRVRDIYATSGIASLILYQRGTAKHVRRPLTYSQRNAQRFALKIPITTTCRWLLEYPLYQMCIEEEDFETAGGLLLNKDNDGAGKLTSFKFCRQCSSDPSCCG